MRAATQRATVRMAGEADTAVVHQVMLAAFAEQRGLDPPSSATTESLEDVRAALARGGAVLAWFGRNVVGTARFRLEPDGVEVYVGRVAVLPAYRRRGVATAMMLALEQIAVDRGRTRIRIGVRLGLEANVRLYEGLGYMLVAQERHSRGAAMVGTMVKHLVTGTDAAAGAVSSHGPRRQSGSHG